MLKQLNLNVDGYVLIQGKPTHVTIQSLLYDTQQNTKKTLEGVFYPQNLKKLNRDPSIVSNTYAKQILRSLKSEAAQPSNSPFFEDSPTTEESKRSKPSSTKTRSTTLKPGTKQSDKRKTQKKEFSLTKDDDDDKEYKSCNESFAAQKMEILLSVKKKNSNYSIRKV